MCPLGATSSRPRAELMVGAIDSSSRPRKRCRSRLWHRGQRACGRPPGPGANPSDHVWQTGQKLVCASSGREVTDPECQPGESKEPAPVSGAGSFADDWGQYVAGRSS